MSLLLAGWRVLITRATDQSHSLASQLRDAGAIPICFPLIEITPPVDSSAFEDAMSKINDYDWLVVTSINAARAVELRLDRTQYARRPKLASLSAKVLDGLPMWGKEAEFVAQKTTAIDLALEMPVVPGDRILLPQSDRADCRAADCLRARGAVVDVVVAYRTAIPKGDYARLREILFTRQVDAITFASPSAVQAIVRLFGDAVPSLVGGCVVACIGPTTAAAAEAAGLHGTIVARLQSDAGLVAGLVAHAHERSSGTLRL